MPYWQLFYHIVWSTKGREPLLTPDIEPFVFDFLRRKAIGLGATVLRSMEYLIMSILSLPCRQS